jgi:hypothetical protein
MRLEAMLRSFAIYIFKAFRLCTAESLESVSSAAPRNCQNFSLA